MEAFSFNTAPTYLLRDGDAIYGAAVKRRRLVGGILLLTTTVATNKLHACFIHCSSAALCIARRGHLWFLLGDVTSSWTLLLW